MAFSAKKKALAIVPKCAGTLSFVGSVYILQDILRSPRKRQKSVYHRLVLGLSVYDTMASVVNILSTWPIPSDSVGVYGAMGNTSTCTAQGFFNEVGNICTPIYNASLCMYYMLIIKNGWSDSRVKTIEGRFHVLPLTCGWTMGVLGLVFNLYNNSGWLCWYAPLPGNCLKLDDVECIRGELAHSFRWIHYTIVWGSILFVTIGMMLIHREVLKREKATVKFTNFRLSNDRSDESASRNGSITTRIARNSLTLSSVSEYRRRNRKSRKVAKQALLFVGALYLTWIFTTLTRIFQVVQGKTYFPLLMLMAIFFPLQGFWNALIYLRPRYLRCASKNPSLPFMSIIVEVIFPDEPRNEDSMGMSGHSSSLVAAAKKQFSLTLSKPFKSSEKRASVSRYGSSGANSSSCGGACGDIYEDEDESVNGDSKIGVSNVTVHGESDLLRSSILEKVQSKKNVDQYVVDADDNGKIVMVEVEDRSDNEDDGEDSSDCESIIVEVEDIRGKREGVRNEDVSPMNVKKKSKITWAQNVAECAPPPKQEVTKRDPSDDSNDVNDSSPSGVV